MIKDMGCAVIKLMVTIVDRGKGQRIAEVCKAEHMHFHVICFGRGTSNTEIQDYLGIGETEKDLVISLVPNFRLPSAFSTISRVVQLRKKGRGIVFTIPISGISSMLSQLMTQEEHMEMEREVNRMEKNAKHALIVAIVNRGYTHVVMDAAKSAGATGGTMMDARGIGYEKMESFLGISIHAEKSIVWIICSKESKNSIMQVINQAAGLRTEARGILLSLPVDDVMGLNGGEEEPR